MSFAEYVAGKRTWDCTLSNTSNALGLTCKMNVLTSRNSINKYYLAWYTYVLYFNNLPEFFFCPSVVEMTGIGPSETVSSKAASAQKSSFSS